MKMRNNPKLQLIVSLWGPSCWRPAFGVQCPVPRVWHPFSGIRYPCPVSGVWYLASGAQRLTSSAWCSVSGVWCPLSSVGRPWARESVVTGSEESRLDDDESRWHGEPRNADRPSPSAGSWKARERYSRRPLQGSAALPRHARRHLSRGGRRARESCFHRLPHAFLSPLPTRRYKGVQARLHLVSKTTMPFFSGTNCSRSGDCQQL